MSVKKYLNKETGAEVKLDISYLSKENQDKLTEIVVIEDDKPAILKQRKTR